VQEKKTGAMAKPGTKLLARNFQLFSFVDIILQRNE